MSTLRDKAREVVMMMAGIVGSMGMDTLHVSHACIALTDVPVDRGHDVTTVELSKVTQEAWSRAPHLSPSPDLYLHDIEQLL